MVVARGIAGYATALVCMLKYKRNNFKKKHTKVEEGQCVCVFVCAKKCSHGMKREAHTHANIFIKEATKRERKRARVLSIFSSFLLSISLMVTPVWLRYVHSTLFCSRLFLAFPPPSLFPSLLSVFTALYMSQGFHHFSQFFFRIYIFFPLSERT